MFRIITPVLPQGMTGVIHNVPVYFVGDIPYDYGAFPIRTMFEGRSFDECAAYAQTLPIIKYGPQGIPFIILDPKGRPVRPALSAN